MESRTRYVLKHKSGQYYSKMKDHTSQLWNAMRFLDEEQYHVWLQVSPHIPKRPEEYTLTPVIQTIEESVEHAN